MDNKLILTFLYTFTDTVRFLEEVVVVALATPVQEVFALACVLIIVPAWKCAFTGSYHRSRSTWIYSTRNKRRQQSGCFTFDICPVLQVVCAVIHND